MSLIMEILEDAWNTRLYYKGVPVNLFGIPILWDDKKYNNQSTFQTSIYRLKNNGFIEIKNKKIEITEKGKRYLEIKNKLSIKFHSPFILNAPKNLLLMFDIPESKRSERDWLRWHLKEFQYNMIQQSVWVGPSPLPNKFREYAKNLGLNKYIKTFKLAKPYQIKSSSFSF